MNNIVSVHDESFIRKSTLGYLEALETLSYSEKNGSNSVREICINNASYLSFICLLHHVTRKI